MDSDSGWATHLCSFQEYLCLRQQVPAEDWTQASPQETLPAQVWGSAGAWRVWRPLGCCDRVLQAHQGSSDVEVLSLPGLSEASLHLGDNPSSKKGRKRGEEEGRSEGSTEEGGTRTVEGQAVGQGGAGQEKGREPARPGAAALGARGNPQARCFPATHRESALFLEDSREEEPGEEETETGDSLEARGQDTQSRSEPGTDWSKGAPPHHTQLLLPAGGPEPHNPPVQLSSRSLTPKPAVALS